MIHGWLMPLLEGPIKINGNLILCTDSYTLEEVQLLISVLSNKFVITLGLIHYKTNSKGELTDRIKKFFFTYFNWIS